jgi:hypothetical protein
MYLSKASENQKGDGAATPARNLEAPGVTHEGPVHEGRPDGARYSIHLDTIADETGPYTSIRGWFLARDEIRWLELEFNGVEVKCDVRFPSLDVHQAVNRNGEYPAINALSCGISEVLRCQILDGKPFLIRMSVVATDGHRYILPTQQIDVSGLSAVLM